MSSRARRARRHAGHGKTVAAAFTAVLGLLLSAAPAPGAQSWIKPKADESLLLDIARNGDQWIVVGERGHVLRSNDTEHWTQVQVPTRVMLTSVALNDQGLGVAVGHEATIIRTLDYGATWERVHHDPAEDAPLLDVEILDERRIVAVGAYGLYLESDDAGATWNGRALNARDLAAAEDEKAADDEEADEDLYYDVHLNDLEVAASGKWYIAAEAGTIYRSDDQGQSWLRLPSPYAGSFYGVLPLRGERLLVFGLQGRLFESRDAGAHWRRLETGTQATLSSGGRLDVDRAWVAGYAGVVLSEAPDRDSFHRARLGNRPAFEDAHLLGGGMLLTVGEGGIRRWPPGAWSDNKR